MPACLLLISMRSPICVVPSVWQEDLERAALAKFGSMTALEAEREKRQERREQRSIASYFQPQQGDGQQQGERQQEQEQEQQQQQQDGQPMQLEQEQQQDGQPMQLEQERQQDGQPMQLEQERQGEKQASQQGQAQLGQQRSGQAIASTQQQQQQQHSTLATPGSGPQAWLRALPPLLSERVCMVPRQQPAAAAAAASAASSLASAACAASQVQQQEGQPEYVLYWMKTAVRGHENPALDAAAAAARQLGLPLLAASFLLASHPYASARRYRFWLEGLRDAQAELRRQVG